MTVREMRADEWDAVAELIHASTNAWYEQNLNRSIFRRDDPMGCRVFPEVYEALDPGCCLVVEDEESGELMGSCFYHPRETHMSLGIMNAHPKFAKGGVARALLNEIVARAGENPVRLVSSTMNLDSYSLYTRAGFVPCEMYQDMFVPGEAGLPDAPGGTERVRPATLGDVDAMVALEEEISGIRRGSDFRFFIENAQGCWRVFVIEGAGGLEGFLASIDHPGSNMLGPGAMRSDDDALALIHTQLAAMPKRQPVFLVPTRAGKLVATLYDWGARNCELHVAQVRGEAKDFTGITMPTFMPETG